MQAISPRTLGKEYYHQKLMGPRAKPIFRPTAASKALTTLCARMRKAVGFFHTRRTYVSIDLSGGQADMTEQTLHHT